MGPSSNLIWDFLRELITRLQTKSPKFFRILQIIFAIPAFFSGIPEILSQFGVSMPDWFNYFQNKTAAIIGIVGFIVSKLTTQSNIVAVTSNDGSPVKQTNEKLLPFTARMEDKSAAKKDVPEVRLPK